MAIAPGEAAAEAKATAAKQSEAATKVGGEAAEKIGAKSAASIETPAKTEAAASPTQGAATAGAELAASFVGGAASTAAGAPVADAGGGTAAGGGGEADGESEAAPEGDSEAAATEEKMEAAAPEQAEADAAAEAEETPEIATAVAEESEAEPAIPSGEADATSADTGSAGANFEGGEAAPPVNVAEVALSSPPPSTDTAQTPTSEADTAADSAPPAPASVEEPATSDDDVAAEGSGEGLDVSEQRAAMDSLADGSGGGEPGGGGGGGGAAIEDTPEPEAPDVSGQEPEAAIASVENLPPGKLVGALGGVSSTVGESVARQRAELSANPPEMERPSGSPVTKSAPGPKADAPAVSAKRKIEKGKQGTPQEVPQPKPLPAPLPSPAARTPEPKISSSGETQLGPDDARAIQSSVRNMPTGDPGLQVSTGPAPQVALAGDADPSQVHDQRAKLNESASEATASGRRDAAQPMGEGEIYPTVQPETLRAKTAAGGAAAGGAAAGDGEPGAAMAGGGDADEAAAIIAQEQNGPQLKAAAAQAKSQMAAERASHAEKSAEERATNQKEVAQLEKENAQEQEVQRTNASAEVAKARGEWSAEQQAKVDTANEEAQREQAKGDETIATEEQQANEQAGKHIDAGNEEAAEHRATAEEQAGKKRREAEEESDGVFGWLASKAKAFFDRVKQGITAVFDAARKLVRAAIEKAKQLAVAVIEKASKAIVAAIRAVGAALIAIGDVLLAAFPALREKWRKFIREKVDAAEAAVNRLAEALKAGVQKLLDLLGKALDAALGLLQKGMLAVVAVYSAAVQGIIKAAKAVADAVGAFIALIKDIKANPGGWIRNLGAAVVDGIRNHLWKAFKEAVKNWFNSKLEEVLGIGGMIWGLLKKGGIALKEVGQMAWEGLKSAIPVALITILVEKLVAMIVPAAGAVIAIIEGLQAAWGTVSRIIAAFSKFFTFLKAVKGGGAGPQFADAVAAAAVVVIDFVANWLLKKIRKPAGKIGGKIKAIAQKIAQRLKRVASRVGKALKKVGKKALAQVKKAKGKLKAWRDKRRAGKKKKDDPAKKKADKEKAKRERLEKAVRALEPKVSSLLARGVSKLRLKAQLALWRVRYRLSALSIKGQGRTLRFEARVNPAADFGNGVVVAERELAALIRRIVLEEIGNHPEVKKWRAQATQPSTSLTEPIHQPAAAMQAREQLQTHPPQSGPPFVALGKGKTAEINLGGGTVQEKRASAGEGGAPLEQVQGFPGTGKYKKDVLPDITANSGLSDADFAKNMRSLIQSGKFAGDLNDAQRAIVRRATWLMFGTESARSVGNIAHAPMMLDLVEHGEMGWKEALTGEGGPAGKPAAPLPMTMGEAPKTARTLEGQLATGDDAVEGLTPRQGGQTADAAQVQALLDREAAIIERWVKARAQNALAAGDLAAIEAAIRKFIREFYGINQGFFRQLWQRLIALGRRVSGAVRGVFQ